jgi:hypothetical protein
MEYNGIFFISLLKRGGRGGKKKKFKTLEISGFEDFPN